MIPRQDPALYQGTAWYYARFRPPYPAAMVAVLRDKFGLDGTGRMLDLGCGPGPVAIALAHLFEHVVAMDPEPEMLAEGRAAAERSGVSNIEWIAGGSDDFRARYVSFGHHGKFVSLDGPRTHAGLAL
ncbi:MAG: class I SAM-dependent methyltransferase [Candidatus Binataceae bacterium]